MGSSYFGKVYRNLISNSNGFRGLHNVPRFGNPWRLCLQGCYHAGNQRTPNSPLTFVSKDKSAKPKMLREIANLVKVQVRPGQAAPSFRLMSSTQESDAEFDARCLLTLLLEFLICKGSFSGTLPISTEQTLMAGRSGRFVLLHTSLGTFYPVLHFSSHMRMSSTQLRIYCYS